MHQRRTATCYVVPTAPDMVVDRARAVVERLERTGAVDAVSVRPWPTWGTCEREALLEEVDDWARGRGGRFAVEAGGAPESHVRFPAMGVVCRRGPTLVHAVPYRSANGVVTVESLLQLLERRGWGGLEHRPSPAGAHSSRIEQ